jgi:threonine dehydrogenase-like Zn-dependent dehydrogenase
MDLGANQTYLVEKDKDDRAHAKEIVALFKNQKKPDITIECSGAESSISTAIYATQSGMISFLEVSVCGFRQV